MNNGDKILQDYFLTIHKVITRGIKVAIEATQDCINKGFRNADACDGYLNYVNTLALMLETHHLTEDDIGFPYFQENLPETHFEWLHEDHDLITGFLDELTPITESFDKDGDEDEKLKQIRIILDKIDDRWHQHIGLEEDEYINLIDDLIPYTDRVALIDQFFKYNDQLIKPYYLSIPFMMYNLNAEDRFRWSEGFSQELINQLNSEHWLNKYRSMKPYFLE